MMTAQDGVRILRSKVCNTMAKQGQCPHGGCQAAMDAADAVEQLIRQQAEQQEDHKAMVVKAA
jgi:hypothetical protein